MLDMVDMTWLSLLAGVVAVAFLYSSVGHGGATGYLALAALLGLAPAVARPGALWLNCAVAGIAFARFSLRGHFDWKVFWPLACTSIPFAWIGSQVHLGRHAYGFVLGILLLAAGFFLFRNQTAGADVASRPYPPIAMLSGAALGFLAGLTGIGGGVFLTPLLILLKWTPAKVAGGISALFILVNSAAGLAGLGSRALDLSPVYLWAVLLGIAGAVVGTYFSLSCWNSIGFRRALAGVLWIASAKLFITGS